MLLKNYVFLNTEANIQEFYSIQINIVSSLTVKSNGVFIEKIKCFYSVSVINLILKRKSVFTSSANLIH